LESTTGSAFVDVYTQKQDGKQMGTLVQSDSSGFKFSISMQYTNRGSNGEADFERIRGIRGILVTNVVSNHEQVLLGVEQKKIQTKISFDDGLPFL